MSEDKGTNVTSAQDNFKKHMQSQGGSVKRDTIFNDKSNYGKGDIPRNVSDKFKENFDEIFPNAKKPYWMEKLEKENENKKNEQN